MLSQEKLLKAIQEVLRDCERSEPIGGQERQRIGWIVQHSALTKHRDMAKAAGNDPKKLEDVVRSLEDTVCLQSQDWRKLATKQFAT